MPADLPLDVWTVIAENLTQSEIYRLMSTNRAFLNIAMDQRYRRIEWVQLDDWIVMSLKRLQDPYVAARVRCLHIRAWFLQYLFQREALFDETKERSALQTIRKRFAKLIGRPPPHASVPKSAHIAVSSRLGKLSLPKNMLRSMTKAVTLMVGVTEYKVEWGDLTLNSVTQNFFHSTRRTFSDSLFKLAVHARVSQLEYFLPFADFHRVEELDLKFEYDPSNGDSKSNFITASNESTLVASVAPAINSLADSLRYLTVVSFAKGDHTPFLAGIGPLPKLRLLALRISFGKEYLSDPTPIVNLINSHRSTLDIVEVCPHLPERQLRTIPYANSQPVYPPQDPHVIRTGSALTRQWLEDTAWIENIQHLTIPAFDHCTILALLRQASVSCNLRKLCLQGRYMEFREVEDVVKALGPCSALESLSIEPQHNSLSSHLLLTERNALLPWTLRDLSVFYKQIRGDSIIVMPETPGEERLMHVLKDFALPSVKSFKGRGHTNCPPHMSSRVMLN